MRTDVYRFTFARAVDLVEAEGTLQLAILATEGLFGDSPVDFTIVIDTREQQPYGFGCAMERRKLDAGDYSVVGCESQLAVERKSLPDFVHTVIDGSNRFRAELEKLSAFELACVVVEADLDAVLRGLRRPDLRMATPSAVLGAALHIAMRHRVPVYWCGSREAACTFTEAFHRMLTTNSVNVLDGKVGAAAVDDQSRWIVIDQFREREAFKNYLRDLVLDEIPREQTCIRIGDDYGLRRAVRHVRNMSRRTLIGLWSTRASQEAVA